MLNNKRLQFVLKWEKETKIFFYIFYFVGIVGLLQPITAPLFLKLVPFALILSFVGLTIFHVAKFDEKSVMVFAAIFLLGFAIEAIGVNTGSIFGHYEYGNSLGIKLFATPLIIGINWLFLVYTTASVFEHFKLYIRWKIILASLVMLLYDVVMEQVAPRIEMWSWEKSMVPLKNYLAWFIVAIFFHVLIRVFKVKTVNKLASTILICQFLFFMSLYLFKS